MDGRGEVCELLPFSIYFYSCSVMPVLEITSPLIACSLVELFLLFCVDSANELGSLGVVVTPWFPKVWYMYHYWYTK
jgi:hypothetical protein